MRDLFYINLNRSEAIKKIKNLETLALGYEEDIENLRKEDASIRNYINEIFARVEKRLNQIDQKHTNHSELMD